MDKDDRDIAVATEPEESFEELLNRSSIQTFRLNPGDEVEAVIIKITKDWVFIDSGGKSEGYIVLDEFKDDDGNIQINEGDRIKAYFVSSRNNERLFTTRLTVDSGDKGLLREAYYNRIPIQGLVEKEIKGGFEVRIAGNVHAFCPYSQISFHRVNNIDEYIGKEMTFKIIEYGEKGRNLVISHRTVLEEERQKKREALRQSLKEGMQVTGIITSIRKFGAFVDIGGIEGLVPISEISWGRVEDISHVLSVGQQVDVMIKKLDWENDKFSFSLKDMIPDPWEDIEKKYTEGSVHQGKVVRLTPIGAFVTLEPGIDGLIHISEIGKGKRIRHPREALELQQPLYVRIIRLDKAKKRLSLAIVRDEMNSEESDEDKNVTAYGRNASGSLGTIGDIIRAKLDKKGLSEKK